MRRYLHLPDTVCSDALYYKVCRESLLEESNFALCAMDDSAAFRSLNLAVAIRVPGVVRVLSIDVWRSSFCLSSDCTLKHTLQVQKAGSSWSCRWPLRSVRWSSHPFRSSLFFEPLLSASTLSGLSFLSQSLDNEFIRLNGLLLLIAPRKSVGFSGPHHIWSADSSGCTFGSSDWKGDWSSWEYYLHSNIHPRFAFQFTLI